MLTTIKTKRTVLLKFMYIHVILTDRRLTNIVPHSVIIRHHHHNWTAVVSRGWAKASACRLQVSMSCGVLCHIASAQYLSRLSFRRLTGFPCRIYLSYGLNLVISEVRRSSLMRLMCPAKDHFISLTFLIISMIFVLSL